ncbi:MAG: helix-turn-helix transcriptional regulator [Pedobacter sp.]|uniref:helix-turn-helix domain-containing protein n=1 Tax=Pedobacter sp. TaxID=1411316 RepID=UPI003567418D
MADKSNTSEIDLFVIARVKKMREEAGLTQSQLAFKMDVSYGFIGQVESSSHRAKYNINHLNKLAKIFDCDFNAFFPDKPF